jgi:triphosphoribosyl-dephospho-CoA synthase
MLSFETRELARTPMPPSAPAAAIRQYSGLLARQALAALHGELLLYPKPGLVSPVDTGSHTDMDAATFMRSLFTLRHYFVRVASAGAAGARFASLRELGIAAERRMLLATGGVNTHRGAIFSLGLLCAALGRLHARGMPATPAAVRAILMLCWGEELARHADGGDDGSHGAAVARSHAAGGAREEAALGMPAVFEVGLPALRASLAAGRGKERARIDTLFALMAQVGDTNVLFRGGAAGAAFVRDTAADFIASGGTGNPQWRSRAVAAHHAFVARQLSPGGAADLLAATCLVHACTV